MTREELEQQIRMVSADLDSVQPLVRAGQIDEAKAAMLESELGAKRAELMQQLEALQ